MSMAKRRKLLRDYVLRLMAMPPEEQRARLARLTPEEILILDAAFEAWAHEGQLPPGDEGWRTWLMMAGRGFGKTRAGAEWIYELAWSRPVRIALVGATIDEARRVMVEGASGILSIARRWRHKVKWEPSKSELTWQRGSVATLFSGDNADGLRGPEHAFAWFLTFEIEADDGSVSLGHVLADVLVAGAVEEEPRAAPPPSPAIGSCYIIADAATGDWQGRDRQVAAYTIGGWRYVSPVEGMALHVRSSRVAATFLSSGWELGVLRGSSLVVGGDQVVSGRAAAIADPAGGTKADPEARAAISAILAALRGHGLIAT